MMANDDKSALLADDLAGLVDYAVCRADWLCADDCSVCSRDETNWRKAADAITALHARVQELEAKWVELPGVE